MTLSIEDQNGIVTVRIDRPDARNALDRQTIAELTEVARQLRARTDVRAVILGGGDRFFSCGVDLNASGDSGRLKLIERREAARAGPDLCRAWEEIEAVTIAAIEGYCVGGACALALACDFRILGKGAMMRLPEVAIGMNMSWQTLPRLARLAGASRAKRMVLFGEPVDAETAMSWSVADDVAPDGQALQVAAAWASKVAALPPIPVRMTKEAINRSIGALDASTSFMDRDQFLLASLSADFAEGVGAFLEKRTPRFEGD